MAVVALDLVVAHVLVRRPQRADDLLQLVRRVQPVAAEAHDEEPRLDVGERLDQRAVLAREVEVVQRARDVEQRVGVEATGEAQPLVAQVALHLEVGGERERVVVDVLQTAAELLLHRLVAQVGDVPDHARDAQALGRRLAAVVVAAAPVGVGHDRLPADLVEGDRHRRLTRRRGQRHAEVRAVGMRDRQLEHLHAAHRAAHGGQQLADAEVIEQQHLRVHHVPDGDDREVGAVRPARGRVLRGRPGAPAAAADDVGADDEVLVGVQSLAGTDHHVPPARALVLGGVQPGDVGVSGERVGDEDGVVLAPLSVPYVS